MERKEIIKKLFSTQKRYKQDHPQINNPNKTIKILKIESEEKVNKQIKTMEMSNRELI